MKMPMNDKILSIGEIQKAIIPLASEFFIDEVYVFGSYARGEADVDSDIDILVIGGKHFKSTNIFAFAHRLRKMLNKPVDAFEIREVNTGTAFYDSVMKERVRIA